MLRGILLVVLRTEVVVSVCGLVFVCVSRLPFPRLLVLERICPFLVMPWRGILCPRATTFPFLSFSRKTTKKKVNFSTPLPLVWNECSTSILHVLFSSCQPEFSGISSCFLSSSSPSASLGHHLTHLQLSLMVSAQKENYNSAPGRFTLSPLQNPFPESTNASSSE